MYDFTVSNVIRRTFAVVGRHAVSFAIVAVLLSFLPNVLSPLSGNTSVRTFDAAQGVQVSSSTYSPLGSAGSIVVWILSLVFYGIVIRATLDDERGRPSDSASWIAGSIRAFLPNLGIYLLYYLAITVGLLLLLVPGLMLACAWSIVVPVNMAEGTGVWGAFGRSRALTAGHRWRIFGLLLLYVVVLLVIGGVGLFGIAKSFGQGVNSTPIWATKIVVSAFSAALNLLGCSGTTAMYLELRAAEGRTLSSDIASAFE